MSVNPISPDVFQGGQMTDLPVFTGTLNGTELIEVVAAPSGQSNAAAGVNYQISTALLAQLLLALGSVVVLVDGDHNSPGNPYVPGPIVTRIYVNKIAPEATYIALGSASSYIVEPLVKDVAGTASAGNPITVSFVGGEQADGNAPVLISTAYGGYFFRPISTLDTWTLGSP